MKFIKKNKKLIVLGILAVLLIIFIIFIVRMFVYPTDGPIYGNRLDGIDEVKINDNKSNEIESSLLSNSNIKSAKMYIQGKIVNILIDVQNISVDDAKGALNGTLGSFSDKEKSFYDFQYFITNSSDENNESYPVIGYKSKSNDSITWTK